MIVLGDDNLFAVTEQYQQIFTEKGISVFMSELGLVYTNDKKDDHSDSLRNLYETTFLKRSFTPDPIEFNAWLMPLDLQVVLEMTCWTKKHDPEKITRSNIKTSVRELSLHGREVFDKHVPSLKKLMASLNYGEDDDIWDFDVVRALVRESDGFM